MRDSNTSSNTLLTSKRSSNHIQHEKHSHPFQMCNTLPQTPNKKNLKQILTSTEIPPESIKPPANPLSLYKPLRTHTHKSVATCCSHYIHAEPLIIPWSSWVAAGARGALSPDRREADDKFGAITGLRNSARPLRGPRAFYRRRLPRLRRALCAARAIGIRCWLVQRSRGDCKSRGFVILGGWDLLLRALVIFCWMFIEILCAIISTVNGNNQWSS